MVTWQRRISVGSRRVMSVTALGLSSLYSYPLLPDRPSSCFLDGGAGPSGGMWALQMKFAITEFSEVGPAALVTFSTSWRLIHQPHPSGFHDLAVDNRGGGVPIVSLRLAHLSVDGKYWKNHELGRSRRSEPREKHYYCHSRGGACEFSSAQSASGMESCASSSVSLTRSARPMPTIVEVTRGSRRENCSAAAANGMLWSRHARCIAWARSSSSLGASRDS